MNQFDKNITIGPEWFNTVKKDYADWRFAWTREAAQNSLDADATQITITVEHDEDSDETTVSWDDNGCGMNEATLEAKFMAIGGSQKTEGNTGGFGIAKLILAFAQKRYSIRTRDIHVRGEGAQYSVESGLPNKRGLCLTVVMNGNEAGDMRDRIKLWVRFTTTRCEIILNGEALTTLRMHRPKAQNEWCKVYTHDIGNDYSHQVRVRVNQQYMFDIYTSVPRHITVDLMGDSTEYLTSNRDGMNWRWRAKLQKLIEEIYANPKQITETDDHVRIYRGTKGRIAWQQEKPRKIALNTKPAMVAAYATTEGEPNARECVPCSLPPGKQSFQEVQHLIDGFDVLLVNKTSKEVPGKWIPGELSKVNYKLLNRWIRIIQTVGQILNRTEAVTIGWVFSFDARAMHRYDDDHGHMLLLNPVDVKETRFTNHWRADISSFYEMVVCAVHEITHIDNSGHTESFARDITFSMGKVMARQMLLEKVRKETS